MHDVGTGTGIAAIQRQLRGVGVVGQAGVMVLSLIHIFTCIFSLWVSSAIVDLPEWATSLFRCVFYLPVVTGSVAVTVVWKWMYNNYYGIFNYLGLGPAAHSCMGGKRFCYAPDTAAFLQDAAAPIMDGSCGAEDYLILQLRLRKGLDLDAYKTLYGKQFSTAQLAFVQNCVRRCV